MLLVYLVVGVTALAAVPAVAMAGSDAPLRLVIEASPLDGLAIVTRIGAAIAALGDLLNLVPGVSRTVLAMARRDELPSALAVVDARQSLPLRAELAVAAALIVLVLVVDLRGAIGFAGVTVLTYYAITNAAAWTLPSQERRWPRWISVVGLVGCVALAVALPVAHLLSGVAVLLLGVIIRVATHRRLT